MGKYSFYIWSAYGISAVVLFGALCHMRYYKIKIKQRMQQWYQLFSSIQDE